METQEITIGLDTSSVETYMHAVRGAAQDYLQTTVSFDASGRRKEYWRPDQSNRKNLEEALSIDFASERSLENNGERLAAIKQVLGRYPSPVLASRDNVRLGGVRESVGVLTPNLPSDEDDLRADNRFTFEQDGRISGFRFNMVTQTGIQPSHIDYDIAFKLVINDTKITVGPNLSRLTDMQNIQEQVSSVAAIHTKILQAELASKHLK